MRLVQQLVGVGFVAMLGLQGLGCQDPAAGQAPDVDDGPLDPETVSAQVGTAWTATANDPELDHKTMISGYQYNYMRGKATFTGPASSLHKAGVCTLKMVGSTSWEFVACNPGHLDAIGSAYDCPAYPAGGYNYCLDIYKDGNYRCFQRPGSEQSWCAGSPKTQAPETMPAGTTTKVLYTPVWLQSGPAMTGNYYVTRACLDVTNCENSPSLIWVYNPSYMGGGGGSSGGVEP